MRTTLEIDDDILNVAKELAVERKVSAGKVISDLARRGLTGDAAESKEFDDGIPLLPDHGQIVTPEFIDRLMEESE